MNRKIYLEQLKLSLSKLPSKEVDDILFDIDERFQSGIDEGQSEEHIVALLGSPEALSISYLNEIPEEIVELKTAEALETAKPSELNPKVQVNYPPQGRKKTNVGLLIVLIFLNLTFVFGPYVGFWGTLIGLFFAAFGLILSGGLISLLAFSPEGIQWVIHMPSRFYYEPLGVFAFGIGIGALGLLLFIGTTYLSELLVKTTSTYFKWMKSII